MARLWLNNYDEDLDTSDLVELSLKRIEWELYKYFLDKQEIIWKDVLAKLRSILSPEISYRHAFWYWKYWNQTWYWLYSFCSEQIENPILLERKLNAIKKELD